MPPTEPQGTSSKRLHTTPTKAPSKGKQPCTGDPPGAPLKTPKDKPKSWADFVDDMDTMPVEEAKRLAPTDFGVHMGPVMDEAQFEAYRASRKGVTVLGRGPAKK